MCQKENKLTSKVISKSNILGRAKFGIPKKNKHNYRAKKLVWVYYKLETKLTVVKTVMLSCHFIFSNNCKNLCYPVILV